MITPRKSKAERFRVVAQRRTRKAMRAMWLLARCAKRASYDYDDAQVEEIFGAIDTAVRAARQRFTPETEPEFVLHDRTETQKEGR